MFREEVMLSFILDAGKGFSTLPSVGLGMLRKGKQIQAKVKICPKLQISESTWYILCVQNIVAGGGGCAARLSMSMMNSWGKILGFYSTIY